MSSTFDIEIDGTVCRLLLNGNGMTLEASEAARERGGIRATVSVRRGELTVYRDQVSLTNGRARDAFVKALKEKTAYDLSAEPLLALEEALRQEVLSSASASPSSDLGLELLRRGETTRLIHPAQDVVDGGLWYGVPVGDALVMVSSDRQVVARDALPRGLALRHTALRESSVSRNVALAWSAGATSSVAETLDALAGFFRAYLVFADPRTPALLAAWTLGTWVYRAFRIFPYLSIRSPEKRCGKTRLLAVLRFVAFNASPITAVPTEAQLFRGAASTGGAQLFDEVEGLRGNKERFDALISVLNVGFERGGVVTRLEKRGDRFEEQRYEAYAPRALAGIAALKETLADRSLWVYMTRKRRDEKIARLTAAVEVEADALRERCALACLSRIGDIITASEQAPALLERERVDDRATDLWTPLVALALVADAEVGGGDRAATLLAVARDLGGLRDADQADGQTARLIEALGAIRETAIRETKGDELAPEALRAALAERPGFAWVTTTRRLAGLLNPVGFHREDRRVTKPRYVYRLDADQLADLRARYGGPDDAAAGGES